MKGHEYKNKNSVTFNTFLSHQVNNEQVKTTCNDRVYINVATAFLK